MSNKILISCLFICSSFFVSAVEKNVAQDSTTIKKYENAGVCFGSYDAAVAKGSSINSFSQKTKNKLMELPKNYAAADKYNDIRKKCHIQGMTINETKACIDNSISNKSIAAFWKGYVAGLEYTYAKDKGGAEVIADLQCLLVE